MFNWKWTLKELPTPGHLKALSLFSSIGGSSLGYKLAGIDVLGGVEIDRSFFNLYVANLNPKFAFNVDVRDFNNMTDLPKEFYNLDILDASPPCSTFSNAGKRQKSWGVEKKFREGQKLQRLDTLIFEPVKAAARFRPKIVIVEIVTGLVKGNARKYAAALVKGFRKIGYRVQVFCLNAALMGVPQRRERIFFIANRIGAPELKLDFNMPLIPFGLVRSAHGTHPFQNMASLLEHFEFGDRDVGFITHRVLGRRTMFNWGFNYDEFVSRTLCANGGLIRVCDRQILSADDCIAIMSFPTDYDWCGRDPRHILGYAVPPVMIANIASEIIRQWHLEG